MGKGASNAVTNAINFTLLRSRAGGRFSGNELWVRKGEARLWNSFSNSNLGWSKGLSSIFHANGNPDGTGSVTRSPGPVAWVQGSGGQEGGRKG